jgi:potassium-dependent mechanosensitive channel
MPASLQPFSRSLSAFVCFFAVAAMPWVTQLHAQSWSGVRVSTVQNGVTYSPVSSLPQGTMSQERVISGVPQRVISGVQERIAREIPPAVNSYAKSNQTSSNQVYPSQTYSAQSSSNQTFPNQTFPNQTFPNQTYSNQTNRSLNNNQLHPIAAEIARSNDELRDRWSNLIALENEASDHLYQLNYESGFLQDDFATVQNKLNEFGLTPTIGMLLRHRREQLDNLHLHETMIKYVRAQMQSAQASQLELDLLSQEVADINQETENVLGRSSHLMAGNDVSYVRNQVWNLVAERKNWLDQLRGGYRDYVSRLNDLDTSATSSKATVSRYRQLIDKNVTWIRTGQTLKVSDFGHAAIGVASLLDSRRTNDFGFALSQKLSSQSLLAFGGAFLMLVMVFVRWRLKKAISDRGLARHRDPTLPRQVAGVGLMTLILAGIVPGAIYAIAAFLRSDNETSISLLHAAKAFGTAAVVLLLVEIPREASRAMGLIDKQVLTSFPSRQSLFRWLTALATVLPPLAYLVTLTEVMDTGLWRESLSRICFIAFVSILAMAGHWLFRPKRGLMQPVLKATHNGWAHRGRYILYVLAVGMPLALITLSILGYGYTAQELLRRSIGTVIFLAITWVCVKMGGQVISRIWNQIQNDEQETPKNTLASNVVSKLAERLDKEKQQALESHLGFLGRCGIAAAILGGMLMLWIEILPSVQMFNPTVWTIHEAEHRMVATNDGFYDWEPHLVAYPITLARIALALATVFFTIQIAKTLPLLMDVFVLNHLLYDEAMKRMLVACGRTLIFLIGGVIAFRLIGVRWEMVQWIVTALAIGLGIGMQDMVRNFLGGLVVLYERPAKCGDRITIGKLTGRVTAQRLRTTVLADDDGRELIIPNKKFISEDIVNWTQTKKVKRAA